MKNILLTGIPRAGKTTIIRKTLAAIEEKCAGFYTDEISEDDKRVGFRLSTLDNKSCILAHKSIKGRHKVGKYKVNLDCIERIGVASIREGIKNKKIIIIDEIGKMELFSNRLKDIVIEVLDSDSNVLGTILSRSHPFCDRIKGRKDVEVIEVNEDNRDSLPDTIIKKLI